MKIFGGAGKGGGGYHEDADNLFSYSTINMAHLICEGEIDNFAKNDPLKCIYFNGVPIRNDNEADFTGPVNFSFFNVDLKYGTEDQTPFDNFTETIRSVAVGKAILHSIPEGVPYNVIDHNVKKCVLGLRVNRLVKQNVSDSGVNITGNKVTFAIYVNDILYGNYTISGKTSSGYVREFTVDLGNTIAEVGEAVIRVVKTNDDATSSTDGQDLQWDYVNEVIPYQFNYPHSCICGVSVDSRTFTSTPSVSFHLKFLKIQIPTNYDPIARTYNGEWDGTFQTAWSNNPAWILYDILTNKRYGVGAINLCGNGDYIDKWKLYQIGQYCDELVPSGEVDGDNNPILEPRFTCNAAIYDRKNAIDVINDLVSVFRVMPVWYSNRLTFFQDAPADSIALFNNTNILGDGFTYQSTSLPQRHSVAYVSYLNKNNYFQRDLVTYQDAEAVKRIGYKEINISSFGCTSRGQALRLAKWAVLSNYYESEIVSFRTSYESLYLTPGDIIGIFDNQRYLARSAGRILAVDSQLTTLTLDSEVYLDPTKENKISIVVPKGNYSYGDIMDSSQIPQLKTQQFDVRNIVVNSIEPITTNQIVLDQPLSDLPAEQAVWIVESTSFNSENYFYQDQEEFNELLANMQNNFSSSVKAVNLYQSQIRLYRVTNISDMSDGVYEIGAVEYNPDKFVAIDSVTNTTTAVVQPPSNQFVPATVTNLICNKVFGTTNTINASWTPSASVNQYPNQVSYSISYINYAVSSSEVPVGLTTNTNYSLSGLSNGQYIFIVRTYCNGVYSAPASINVSFGSIWNGDMTWETDSTITTDDIYVDGLALTNGYNGTGYANPSPSFSWALSNTQYNQDFSGYSIQLFNKSGVQFLQQIAPLDSGSYVFDSTINTAAIGGPYREFFVKVGVLDYGGITSGFSDLLHVNNPPPDKILFGSNATIRGDANAITVLQPWLTLSYIQGAQQSGLPNQDINGTKIYYSTGLFTTGNINQKTSDPTRADIFILDTAGINSQVSVPVGGNQQYYVVATNYDSMGKFFLNYSDVQAVTPYGTSTVPPNPISALMLTSAIMSGDTGYITIRLSGVWNPSTDPNSIFYDFQIRKSGDSQYNSYLTTNNFYFVDNVIPNRNYQVRVRSLSSAGIGSNFVTGNILTVNANLSASITSVPIGGFLGMANGNIPAGQSGVFSICDGHPLPTGSYSDLFNVIGYAFGSVSGGAGFKLPSGQYNETNPYMIRII